MFQVTAEVRLVKALRAAGLTREAEVACAEHDTRPSAPLCWHRQRVAVFAKTCQLYGCKQHAKPTTRLARARVRDRKREFSASLRRLHAAGFRAVIWWEHQDLSQVVARVREELRGRALRRTA